MVAWLISAAGGVVVLLVLRDIFHTLWHPQGFGVIAQAVFSGIWRVAGVFAPDRRRTPLTGPLGLLGTVLVWTLLMVVGWTLVYTPYMPDSFNFGSSLKPATAADLLSSIYLSLVTVTTLGYGDVTPDHPALRLLAPMEALIGFVLLTAGITWVLQLYPALARRRSLARHLFSLQRGGVADIVTTDHGGATVPILESVASRVAEVEMDLRQYRESYYFRDAEQSLSLAAALPVAFRLAEAGVQAHQPAVAAAAESLRSSIDAVSHVLDATLRCGGGTDDILRAFAVAHGHADAARPGRAEPDSVH